VDVGDAEDGHDGIARVLLHGPAIGLDLLPHLVEEGGEEGAQVLGVVARGQLGRPGQVGEEDGDRFRSSLAAMGPL